MGGTRLVDKVKFVTGLAPVVPSSAAPRAVSLKNADHLTIVISVANGTTVTGSAISLSQGSAVAMGDAKALAFDTVFANVDTAAGDALTATAVAANTFTTGTVNSKAMKYVIELDAQALDRNNSFDCVRVNVGNAVAATVSVEYILSGLRHGGNVALMPSAIVD